MDAMIVNVTTEASRFAGRAVVAVLLLVGFWLAGLMVQRLMARLERAEHARQDVVALLGFSPASCSWSTGPSPATTSSA